MILILLSLLLQVQSVFACELSGQSGLVEHCCCDEMKKSQGRQEGDNVEYESQCCDFSAELLLKTGAGDVDVEPLTVHSPPFVQIPPDISVVESTIVWPKVVNVLLQTPTSSSNIGLNHPGSQTYLSTLRLRI